MTVLPPFSLRESRIIDDVQCLRCSKCKDWKPLDQFGATKHRRSGRQSHCKVCKNAFMKDYQAKVRARKAKNRAEMAQDAPSKSKVKRVPKLSKTLQNGLKSKRKAINPVSDKRKSQLAEYAVIRLEFLGHHPVCQVCRIRPSEVIHHVNSRAGKMLNDFTQVKACCNPCHDRIHQEPAWAKEHGLYHSELK